MLGDLGDERNCCADDVWRLRRHVDGELGGGPVIVGNRSAGFDRRRVRTRVVHVDFRDQVSVSECPVGAVAIPDFPVEHDVVVLIDFVVADEWRAGRECLLRVDDWR